MEDYVLPGQINSSESDDQKEFTIDIDSMMALLKTKISSLKLKDVPTLFVERKISSDLEGNIKEQIPTLEDWGVKFPYDSFIDFQIKQYIFENYSKEIFRYDDDLYRLYMYVFDPYGEEYANIYSQVFGPDEIYSRNNERIVKQRYIKYLKHKYHENPDYFDSHIQKYFKDTRKTGFDFMPDGSNKRRMRDVADNESVRCPKENVKIVHGHGRIIPGEIFRIPSGAKVITLSQTNVCIPQMNSVDDLQDVFVPFMKLYMDGGSIFENDDSVKKINSNFETLIDKYKNLGPEFTDDEMDTHNHLNFQYALHLPGDIISDMLIQTEGRDCGNSLYGYEGCNILCFEKGEYGLKKENNTYLNYIKFVAGGDGTFPYEHDPDPDKKMTKMSNVLEEMGDGTYIIYACRYSGEPSYELSRSLSNTVRLPGYDRIPEGPIRPDGMFTLSTRNQPQDIDEKKIYRYHIDFLEDYVDLKQENENLKTIVESLKSEIDIHIDNQSQLLKSLSQRGGKKSRRKLRKKSRKKSRRKNSK